MPEIIFLIFIIIYFTLLVLFTIGLKKKFPKTNKNTPSVSVIVCARNEENNIGNCIASLDNLKYPFDKLQIIIADDHSTDNTGKIIDESILGKPNFCKLIPEQNGRLKGKINALNSAIKNASGEVILLTDADCVVQESWVSETISYYAGNTGMVCGFTKVNADKPFYGMQSIDLTFLLSIASGTANIKKPVSCIGNNISFRKEAYVKTGGFEKFPFSVTEDHLLLTEISKLEEYQVLFPLDNGTAVQSKACPNLDSLIKQKKRWAAGGMNSSPYGLLLMGTAFLTNLLMIIAVSFFSSVSLYLAVFKIAMDYFFIYPVHKILWTEKHLKYFILFEVYYILYTTFLPVLLLFNRKVTWKGRTY